MADIFVSRGQSKGCRKPWLTGVFSALALSLILTVPANAGSFTGSYDLSNWVLTNTAQTDGSVMTPDSGLTLVFTGGNSGSGNPGTTDFFISAPAAGQVQFSWSYTSTDSTTPVCGNSGTLICDDGGYLLGGVYSGGVLSGSTYTELADDTTWMTVGSGNVNFAVTSGEFFGFQIDTADNLGGPGVLTITDFSAPLNTNAPEPGTMSVALGLGATMILAWWRKRRAQIKPAPARLR
jgi:hypothetical protein